VVAEEMKEVPEIQDLMMEPEEAMQEMTIVSPKYFKIPLILLQYIILAQ